MYDISKLTSESAKSTFKYWFTFQGSGSWAIYKKDQTGQFKPYTADTDSEIKYSEIVDAPIGDELTVSSSSDTSSTSSWVYSKDEIEQEFKRFMEERPEYLIGGVHFLNDGNTDLYEKFLVGSLLCKCGPEDPEPEVNLSKITRCIDWLHTTDFYTAPASTRFHSAEPGGLLTHTLDVIREVRNLVCDSMVWNPKSLPSAIFCAAVHDWCKIGLYEEYDKNVKDEKSGRWKKEKAYRVCKDPLTCFGHGVSSMFLASRFFKLSTEEALAIRWHMGTWRVANDDMNELQQANENYPLVHLLQFADQLSITKYVNFKY